MSEDEPNADAAPEIKPLKAATTRTEGVESEPSEAGADEAQIEPLRAATTRTEEVHVDDTPLILMDEGDALDTESEDLTVPELIGEVKRLRSQVQIVRTERTSVAGRKYALEVVIESLREKVEQAGVLLEEIEDPGELGELVRSLSLILGDARRIAETKAVLAQDLEEERRRHLEERQSFEQRSVEHEEAISGLRAERDSLRTTVARLEDERLGWMEKLADAQDQLNDHDSKLSEVESKASERMEAYAERMQGLEAELEAAQRASAAAERALKEETEKLNAALAEASEKAERTTQRLQKIEPELETTKQDLVLAKAELEAADQIAADLEVERSAHVSTVSEMTEILTSREAVNKDLEDEKKAHRRTAREYDEAASALEAEQREHRKTREALEALTEGQAELEAAKARAETRVAELEEKSTSLASAQERGEHAVGALRSELEQARTELEITREDLKASETRFAANANRVAALEQRNEASASELEGLKAEVEELRAKDEERLVLINDQRKALIDVKPMLEDWTRLDKENQRLSRLVGEARSRGRVNVQELMARAALLKRLEKLTEEVE